MSSSREGVPLLNDYDERQRANGINASGTQQTIVGGGVYEEQVRPVLAELIAVMLFVCVGVLFVQYADNETSAASVALAIAAGHGLTIAVLVTAFGDISGGHVNPVVTVGIALAGEIGPLKTVLYILAQLTGAVAGAGLSKAILPAKLYTDIGGGAHTLGEGVKPWEGVLCEIVLTTLLVLTVLITAVDPKTRSPLAPLAIGLIVLVDILAGLQITGASMNPARSFGPALVISAETSHYWEYHYVYWVGPLLGSCIAGVCYRLLFASGEKRLVFKSRQN